MKTYISTVIAVALVTAVVHAQAIAGDWIGTLSVNSLKLRVVFHIISTAGGLTATMDSVDQNVKGIPATSATLDNGTLTVTIAASGITFTGVVAKDGAGIQGTWSQRGNSMPLVLTRLTAPLPDRRPQDPVKPYPYREEDVSYPNPSARITLAATLTLPEGPGPFPAVLLIGGSGAHDRDEALMGHRPFLVLADQLTRHGIAVLRADKRGVGKSGGTFATATIDDFASDAEAGVQYLLTRAEIDRRAIGLAGHSEGGLVAPMVASKDRAIAFVVMLAGPGVPGDQILVAQVRAIALAMGVSTTQAEAAATTERAVLDIIAHETDPAAIRSQLATTLGVPASSPQVDQAVAQLMSPWMHSFLTTDPGEALRHVTCPVLALIGSKDVQVPAAENLPAIRSALTASGNARVDVEELPGLNHLFQTAKTGAPAEYGDISETMAPVALEKIISWIQALPKAKNP